MTTKLAFLVKHSTAMGARTGFLTVNGHQVATPAIVQTGSVIGTLTPSELAECQTQIIKVNVIDYWRHFGARLPQLGDLHRLIGWDGVILTDPGAEQAYRWAKPRGRKPSGVHFHDPQTNEMKLYTPLAALRGQAVLGADIMQSFARMADYYAPVDDLKAAVTQTTNWLQEFSLPANCLATIVGGGLKRARQANIAALPASVAGYCIAGVASMVPIEEQQRLVEEVITMLPSGGLRYLPTSGTLHQLFTMLASGVDLIDSDLAGREANMGNALVGGGHRLHLDRGHFAVDQRPIVPGCACPVCQNDISRAEIHQLLIHHQPLGERYLLLHNLFTINQMVSAFRTAIMANHQTEFLAKLGWNPGQQ